MLQPGQYNINSGTSQNGGSFTSLTDLLSSLGDQSYSSNGNYNAPSSSSGYSNTGVLNPGFAKQYGYDGNGGASTSLDSVLSSNVLSTGSSAPTDGTAYRNTRGSSSSGTRFQSVPVGPSMYNPYLNRTTSSTSTATTPEQTQAEKDTSLVDVLARIGNQYNLKKSKTSAL